MVLYTSPTRLPAAPASLVVPESVVPRPGLGVVRLPRPTVLVPPSSLHVRQCLRLASFRLSARAPAPGPMNSMRSSRRRAPARTAVTPSRRFIIHASLPHALTYDTVGNFLFHVAAPMGASFLTIRCTESLISLYAPMT